MTETFYPDLDENEPEDHTAEDAEYERKQNEREKAIADNEAMIEGEHQRERSKMNKKPNKEVKTYESTVKTACDDYNVTIAAAREKHRTSIRAAQRKRDLAIVKAKIYFDRDKK